MVVNDSQPQASAIKILIVDDSPSDRSIFRRYLTQDKEVVYDFTESENITQAFETIKANKFNCILLDYDLPDGNGVELIEKINEAYGKNNVPIVMLSGSGSIEIAVETMRTGAHDYLVKSRATALDLIRAINNAIDKVKLYRDKEFASERIQISEERYRLLFDNTPLPAIVFDRENLNVLAVNDYAVKHYGYSREEFLLMTLNELDSFEGASEEIVVSEFCDERGMIRAIPARHRKKDGTIIDVEVNCHDITFHGRDARFVIVQDITERKEAENKIRESAEFNRTLIESSPDCVKLLDKDGRLEFMNENGLCLMEIDDFTKFENREWHELWTDECRDTVKQTIETAKRGETGRFEGFCPTAKGKPKWWDVIVTPIRDSEGNVEKILSVSRDITQSKIAEQERDENLIREKELREEAESANRSKDEFLAVLSHELRSPLNAMSGWSKMLQRGILDDEKTRQAIDVIERNINLQNHLIEDLLDVSRIISGKLKIEPTDVNICKVVSEAVETARPSAAEKNIRLLFTSKTAVCDVKGDPIRLQQIVGNILTNAFKFTPENGTVSVDLKTHENVMEISVTDSGIGIEAELLPHIFERFRQADGSTKRKFGGLGLGLAIVKSLVEMHGGTISALSGGKNQGSTFTVKLPIPVKKEKQSNGFVKSSGHSKNPNAQKGILDDIEILIVDDEADSLELLSFVLKNNGATVHAFNSAGNALTAIKELSPDLLISDISMGEMDGYDLIRRVREFSAEKFLPAIAMTAYTSVEDRAQILAAGFQMHIGKPFDIEEIPQQVKQVLDSARTF